MTPVLAHAHRGYEYQDLLAAIRLVDVMLGAVVEVHVDEQLIPNDRFDDLTTVAAEGQRERTQFKHTENENQPLSLATFTSDARRLRLDRLVRAALSDRDGPGAGANDLTFRVVLRDARPIDDRLLAVLGLANPDPGPFSSGIPSLRMRFDSEALWRRQATIGTQPESPTDDFSFLREGDAAVSRADLDWVCERLIIEVESPAASRDLTAPGPAEHLLLLRVRNEIGAEVYPNADRSAVDVAEALIRAARAARQGGVTITGQELLRRAQLRHDFGAVARAHPVNKDIEVARVSTVEGLVLAADHAADQGNPLLVVGPPGQGKSWVCQQVIDELTRRGWLVAEHYCYLGDADGERLPRVLAESVFGSLLGRLAEYDARLVADQRPRFAADEQALADAIARARQEQPDRKVALVVDGIDHVTRVKRRSGSTFDPSFTLAESLGSLELPPGSVLLVLSQPGAHLEPLRQTGAVTEQVPILTEAEVRQLAGRLGVVRIGEHSGDAYIAERSPLLVDDEAIGDFVAALSERSAGNALYATYLCREALRHPTTIANPSATVRNLPSFDGSLLSYYEHIYAVVGDQGAWVADVIALLDFPITRAELKEIRPDMAHRVDDALSVLEPVLVERAAQGGVRIYHESFARYLRRAFQDNTAARTALLDHIATWLRARGIFEDSRAFRCLLRTLAEANRDREVVDIVGHDFVERAVAAAFPASAIASNLATALACAGRIEDWPAIVRYVEMGRAAATFQEEQVDSILVDFIDVPMALIGAGTVADRLLHDGHPVMSARSGLQMCAAADEFGAVAPWREYMIAYEREVRDDNTVYGETSDQQVLLALLRGRLRLSATKQGTFATATHDPTEASRVLAQGGDRDQGVSDPAAPINWDRLADHLAEDHLDASRVFDAVLDTYGMSGVVGLIQKLEHPGTFCLALAERIASGRAPVSHGSAYLWAAAAFGHGLPAGTVHRLIALGIKADDIAVKSVAEAREPLLGLTREVQDPSVRWETGRLRSWLDACAFAARRDPLGLSVVEALIDGPGWYRCWLRFTVGVVRAEASPTSEQSRLALIALNLLTEDLNPFTGNPRACDLYRIESVIHETIRRAISLLTDESWREALEILTKVSNALSVTIAGELGGPLPTDELLHLAVETTNSNRRSAAEAPVRGEIESGGRRRYYADLAKYRLLGARLALTANDRSEAWRLWLDACRMLTAYGWHKDTTIYELLDPLPTLITADPGRGRACVAKMQPLCERVPFHTDRKETGGAWARWWELLAKADPIALARLITPALLGHCNAPNSLLHGARFDLWSTWHHRADPILAGALRLTLEEPLVSGDVAALERLADISDGSGADVPARLMTLLLARIDERPFRYMYSNSEELLAGDNKLVDELNLLADRARVPRLAPMPTRGPEADRPSVLSDQPPLPRGSLQRVDATRDAAFPVGAVGLARAIRAWRSGGYAQARQDWTTDRFGNILGYRIVELAEEGREEDAASALALIADASVGDRSGLLTLLGEGLERNSQLHLAAVAYTLAWTRARGHGGWLNFGGETELESLRRAAALDRSLTLTTIVREIEQIISRGPYGTWGVSQAFIYGFAVGGLGSSPDLGLDVAFQAWEEAFTIISKRAPRVDAEDDPDEPYKPQEPETGKELPGDLNVAFAATALAGLAHPAREQKRRSLVAAQILLHGRSREAAPALKAAFTFLSDPVTLTWLLRTLERAGEIAVPVIAECVDILTDLAGRPHLTVRALARRFLGSREAPPPPVDDPDPALLGRGSTYLWIPHNVDSDRRDSSRSNAMVETFAGVRLARAEPILPGLRDAVQRRVATAILGEDYKRRIEAQRDAYADRTEKRWPDAYLALEEVVEDALQRAATGGRVARLSSGLPLHDPVEWEDALARALLDDPRLPLHLEITRQPRPELPPPPPRGDSAWSALHPHGDGEHRGEIDLETASEVKSMLFGTLAVTSAKTVQVINGGPFDGWRLLATLERRTISLQDESGKGDALAQRYRIVEVREIGGIQVTTGPPVQYGDARAWTARLPPDLASRIWKPSLVGVDYDVSVVGDGRYGLGIQTPLLTPSPWLIVALGLRPSIDFVLEDDQGPALALVTWRTEYETSDYHLAWPRLHGVAVALRDDLFDQILDVMQDDLVHRDFLVGDVGLRS